MLTCSSVKAGDGRSHASRKTTIPGKWAAASTNETRDSGMGRRPPTTGGGFDRTSLALPAVFGRRPIWDRNILPVWQRTAGDDSRRETRPGGRFWSRSGDWRHVAAVSELRRPILHLSAAARRRSRSRLGDPDGAAPAVLFGPNRFRSDRRAGAGEKLVADAVLHGLQVPCGRADSYISARR